VRYLCVKVIHSTRRARYVRVLKYQLYWGGTRATSDIPTYLFSTYHLLADSMTNFRDPAVILRDHCAQAFNIWYWGLQILISLFLDSDT